MFFVIEALAPFCGLRISVW